MQAIRREKAVKRMLRREKIEMIERLNPGWDNLAERWFQEL
jgi:predicted GIY-YIG superfamily endonuclease